MPKETITDVKVHPAASIFSLMPDEELEALGNSIERKGQVLPCLFYKGEMIDGRNRWLACKRKGIKPERRTLTKAEIGESVEDYVATLNSDRRDQTAAEKAMTAAALIAMKEKHRGNGRASEEIGAAMGVSPRYVDYAKIVQDKGSPKLKAAVKAGEIKLAHAGKLAKCADYATQNRCLRTGMNAILSEIARHAEPGSKDAEYLQRHEALPPTDYVDDQGRKVPENLHVVWDQKPLVDDQVRAMRTVAYEISQVNKVLQLTDIDELVKDIRAKMKSLASLTPARLSRAHGWITLGETR